MTKRNLFSEHGRPVGPPSRIEVEIMDCEACGAILSETEIEHFGDSLFMTERIAPAGPADVGPVSGGWLCDRCRQLELSESKHWRRAVTS